MPIKTWDSTGTAVYFDSDSVFNGVCLGAYSIAPGTSFSKSFSLLAGATVRAMGLSDVTDMTGVTVTYPGSVPTVTATSHPSRREVVLWATGTPTVLSGAGMQAVSTAGTVALSPQARGCNYVGKATYASTRASTGTPNSGGSLGWLRMSISNCPNPPVPVLGVTSSKYARLKNEPYSLGGDSWGFDVQAFDTPPDPTGSAWPTLLSADVYVFAPPTTTLAGPQAAVYDSDGTLAYDLLANRLLTTAGPLSYPAGSSSDDYYQALPSGVSTSLCGAFGAPFYSESRSFVRGAGLWQQQQFGAAWTLSSIYLKRQWFCEITALEDFPLDYKNEQSAVVEIVNVTGL